MAGKNENIIQEGIQKAISDDWQQGKVLGACMVEMYDRCLLTDIKFRCKDHGLTEAHKLVLAARSPVFRAMFFGPCADGKDEVEVNTAQSETFRLFLRYLYNDDTTLTEDTALAVLEIAHLYQVSNLVQYCVDYLGSVITSSNVCRILTCAMLYDLTDLKTISTSFIDDHAEEVLKTDDFMNLSADCLLYILKGDTVYAKEAVILDVVEKWSRRRVIESRLEETGTNIRNCLGESFYQLRLPTMTSKSLTKCISRKGYFSVEEYADIAAFISKVPGILVSTNSCVQRVPRLETITVNQVGNLLTKDIISSVFEISVTKDVQLSGIVLCEMKPNFKFKGEIYTEEDCVTTTNVKETDLSHYSRKVIRFARQGVLGNPNYEVTILKSLEHVEIPDNIDIVLSGSITISNINLKHEFSLKQTGSENSKVNFKTAIWLKKRNSPFRVQTIFKYVCENGIQVKTRSNNFKANTRSVTGNIKVRSLSGSVEGIKSIEFLNISNRDICKIPASEGTADNTDKVQQG